MKKKLNLKWVRVALYLSLAITILSVFKIKIDLSLFKNIAMGILYFSLVVSPLIIIHEYAHFWVGKKLGAEPEVFSIGMGKKIFGFKWQGADFIISLLPVGGYVRFKKVQFDGENGENSENPTIAPWKWFFIALAGPASNFITAFIVFFSLIMASLSYVKTEKNNEPHLQVLETLFVLEKSSDQIPSLIRLITKASDDNHSVYYFNHLKNQISRSAISESEAMSLVSHLGTSEKITTAFSLTLSLMNHFTQSTIKTLGGLFTDVKTNYKTVSSPIGISQQIKHSVDSGWLYLFILFGALSFGLGFMNILPLSILDGGRCVMAIYQTLVSQKMSVSVVNGLNLISIALVLGLMGVGVFSDLMRNSGL